VVIPGCYPSDYGTFADLGDVSLAAAVEGLPVNSGYTARLDPVFVERICIEGAARFAAHIYRQEVLYVLPNAAEVPPLLTCSPITSKLRACRTANP
jgi:hypothetical protein